MESICSHMAMVWLFLLNVSLVTSLNQSGDPINKKLFTPSEQRIVATKEASPLTVDFVTDRRRLMLASKFMLATSILGTVISSEPLTKEAHAAYGDGSNIALPSYIDFLIEKNKQIDPSTFLYQGADRDIQIQRIGTAVSKLQTIPGIVQSKKWSQVQGVITGPLGTLISTMNQIGGTNKDAQRIISKVKVDLFSIGQCATTKNESACIAATEATINDLNDFVKVAF